MQLCFDFDRVAVTPVPVTDLSGTMPGRSDLVPPRRIRGQVAYYSGQLAEVAVADRYREAGYNVVDMRWRGQAGEIDIILRKDALFVFVEVKAGRDFARAAGRICCRQMARICMAACEFCGSLPTGQMTEMRMDAALVDQFGRIEIIKNAFGDQ
ncbi:MAG: YraN family protein [Paracoccus sp. (in: a-proteobacteria)]